MHLSNHSFTMEKKIKFNFSICVKIRKMGWEFFFSLNELVYPSLILEFYQNAILEPEASIFKVKEWCYMSQVVFFPRYSRCLMLMNLQTLLSQREMSWFIFWKNRCGRNERIVCKSTITRNTPTTYLCSQYFHA